VFLPLIPLVMLAVAPVAPRRIAVNCANERPCAVAGVIVARAAGEPAVESNAVIHGGEALLDLPLDKLWEVELRAAGYWMPRTALLADTATLTVWKTAPLRGRFVLQDPADHPPKSFQLEFQSPPAARTPRIAHESVDCPVSDDGSFDCAIPATTLDIVLRAKTFTPQYKWEIKLEPKVTASLGEIPLRRGASLIAWLDSESAKSLKAPARARLIRETMNDSSAIGQRLMQPVAESAFNERGMVQLAPVPPGTYSLEVTAPGFATARIDQVQIYERSESTLRRVIKLEPPINLELVVIPPRDDRGVRWRMDVYRVDDITGQTSTAGRGEVDDEGALKLPNQAPGRYNVQVRDGRGNIDARRKLTITGPGDARQTIEIELRATSGTVTIGGKPLAATLLFGGQSGTEQIHTTSDAAGEFEVRLPRAGKWRVDVESKDAAVHAAVSVSISDKGEALEIKLPDTELSGWVIGSGGTRVAPAEVVVQTSAGVVSRRTESDGTFRFRGITTGDARIGASDPGTGEYSRQLPVTVVDGEAVKDLELRIDASQQLTGVVTSRGEPLAGALVTGYGMLEGQGRRVKTVTDIDGTFKLSIPSTTSEVLLYVAAAGKTFQAYNATGARDPLRLELASAGGTLRVILRGATNPVIRYNGVAVLLNELLTWAHAQGQLPSGDTATIPNVAPGLYQVCGRVRGQAESCREGTLAAGGTLELTIE
jgi:hypothetical protein